MNATCFLFKIVYDFYESKSIRSIKLYRKVQNNPYAFDVYLPPEHRPYEHCPQHSHHGEFEWFYCRKGGGVQLVGQWSAEVSKGQLLLIPPDMPHVFCGELQTGCNCDVMMLPPSALKGNDEPSKEATTLLNFWKQYVLDHGFLLPLPVDASIRGGELIRNISEASRNGGFGSALNIRNAVGELLSLAFRLPQPPRFRPSTEFTRRDEKIETLLYYLDNNFSRHITVNDALKVTGMSRSAFHPRFQAVTGMTFCRYLNRLRLKAVESMVQKGYTPEDAARHCGFFSRSNFYQQRKNDSDSDTLY